MFLACGALLGLTRAPVCVCVPLRWPLWCHGPQTKQGVLFVSKSFFLVFTFCFLRVGDEWALLAQTFFQLSDDGGG